MTAKCKARTFLHRYKTGIKVYNFARGILAHGNFVVLSCVGRDLVMRRLPFQGAFLSVKRTELILSQNRSDSLVNAGQGKDEHK
jgi:hypothetical protein